MILLLLGSQPGQRKSRRLSDSIPSNPIPTIGNVGRKNSKTAMNTDFLKTPESGMAGYVYLYNTLNIFVIFVRALACSRMHIIYLLDTINLISSFLDTDISKILGFRCGCDCMLVGFTTICAISAYHH